MNHIYGSVTFGQINRVTEANIQAELYHHFKMAGVHCVLEFNTPVGRLDCAVLSDDLTHLVAIVECKLGFEPSETSWQMTRYGKIGPKVYCLKAIADTESMASKIKFQHVLDYDRKNWVTLESVKEMDSLKTRRYHRMFKAEHLDEDLNVKT